MKTQSISRVIDWELPPVEFERQIDDIISACLAENKVIPLPVDMERHPAAGAIQDLLVCLLAKLDCSGCGAECCRNQETNGGHIGLGPREFDSLKARYPDALVGVPKGDLPVPCPLLKDSRCQAYHDRPLICWLYPFQFGGRVGTPGQAREDLAQAAAVASSCPGGRKIAKSAYMTYYGLRRVMVRLKKG